MSYFEDSILSYGQFEKEAKMANSQNEEDLVNILDGFYEQIENKKEVLEEIIRSNFKENKNLQKLDFIFRILSNEITKRCDEYSSLMEMEDKFRLEMIDVGPFYQFIELDVTCFDQIAELLITIIEDLSLNNKETTSDNLKNYTKYLEYVPPLSTMTPPKTEFKLGNYEKLNTISLNAHTICCNELFIFVLGSNMQLSIFPILNNGILQKPYVVTLNFSGSKYDNSDVISIYATLDHLHLIFRLTKNHKNEIKLLKLPISSLISNKIDLSSIAFQNLEKPKTVLCVLTDYVNRIIITSDFEVFIYNLNDNKIINKVKLTNGLCPRNKIYEQLFPNVDYNFVPIETNGTFISFIFTLDDNKLLYRVFSLLTGHHVIDEEFSFSSKIIGCTIDIINKCHWCVCEDDKKHFIQKYIYYGSISPNITNLNTNNFKQYKLSKGSDTSKFLNILYIHLIHSFCSHAIPSFFLFNDVTKLYNLLGALRVFLSYNPKDGKMQFQKYLLILTILIVLDLNIETNKMIKKQTLTTKILEMVDLLPNDLFSFIFFNNFDFFMENIENSQIQKFINERFISLFYNINDFYLRFVLKKLQDSKVFYQIPVVSLSNLSLNSSSSKFDETIVDLLLVHQRNLVTNVYYSLKKDPFAISEFIKNKRKNELNCFDNYLSSIVNLFNFSNSLENSSIFILFMNFIKLISPLYNYHAISQTFLGILGSTISKLTNLSSSEKLKQDIQYICYIFGKFSSTLIKGGGKSEFEDKFLKLIQPSIKFIYNDNFMNQLNSPNIKELNSQDERINLFIENENALDNIYKKFKPFLNRNLRKEVKEIDRISILAICKHLNILDELFLFKQESKIEGKLKDACSEMLKIRSEYQQLLQQQKKTDEFFIKLLMLLRFERNKDFEIKLSLLTDFVKSNYPPKMIVQFIKSQKDRILRTLIGFSLVSKVYNNKIDESLCEIIGYTISQIENFDGLSSILNIRGFENNQVAKVIEFFDFVSTLLIQENGKKNSHYLMIMIIRFFNDLSMVDTIRSAFLEKIINLHKKYPNNYPLFALILGLTYNSDVNLDKYFHNFPKFDKLDWFIISESKNTIENNDWLCNRLFDEINEIICNNAQLNRYLFRPLYSFLPLLSKEKKIKIYDYLLNSIGSKTIKSINVSPYDEIQFMKKVMASKNHENEFLYNYMKKIIGKDKIRTIAILSILSNQINEIYPFSLIHKRTKFETNAFYVIPSSNNELIYFPVPFRIYNTPLKSLVEKKSNIYSVSLYNFNLPDYDIILNNLQLFDDTEQMISLLFAKSFAELCKYPDFTEHITNQTIEMLFKNITPFHDIIKTMELYKKYSKPEDKDLDDNGFNLLKNANSNYVTLLSKQLKLSEKYKLTINCDEGYFGIVSDNVEPFYTTYKIVSSLSGIIYPKNINENKIKFTRSNEYQISIDCKNKIFTVSNVKINFPKGNTFRIIICVKNLNSTRVNCSGVFNDNSISDYKFKLPNYPKSDRKIILQPPDWVWNNISNLLPFDKLPEENMIVNNDVKENNNYHVPPNNLVVHPGFSTFSTGEIKLSIANGILQKLKYQWETISLIRILNNSQEQIQDQYIFNLYSLSVTMLEHFTSKLFNKSMFPFSFNEPIWNSSSASNYIIGSIDIELKSFLNKIVSSEKNIKLIANSLIDMSCSKELHLNSFYNLGIKFYDEVPSAIYHKAKEQFLVFSHDFDGNTPLRVILGTKEHFLPIAVYKTDSMFSLTFKGYKKTDSISVVVISSQDNSWIFGTSLEFLILLKNFVFLANTYELKELIRTIFLNCFIVQSPLIVNYLSSFAEFLDEKFSVTQINITTDYLINLSIVGAMSKALKFGYFNQLYRNEYNLIGSKLAQNLPQYFPVFSIYPIPKPSTFIYSIPIVPIDTGAIFKTDYLNRVNEIKNVLKEYKTIKGFPFWLVYPYWCRITKVIDTDDCFPIIKRLDDGVIEVDNPKLEKALLLFLTKDKNNTILFRTKSFPKRDDDDLLVENIRINPFIEIGKGKVYFIYVKSIPPTILPIDFDLEYIPDVDEKKEKEIDVSQNSMKFIDDMIKFAVDWEISDTFELLKLLPKSEIISLTFDSIRQIVSTSSLCTKFPKIVVILKALFLYHYNYIYLQCENNSILNIPISLKKSMNKYLSIDIISEKVRYDVRITSDKDLIVRISFNRHLAQKIILEGKGDFKNSMIYQFSEYVKSFTAMKFRNYFEDYRYPWRVEFDGEDSIDAGGPAKEALFEISSSIFEKTSKLMVKINKTYLYIPDENSLPAQIDEYYSVGVILGIIFRSQLYQDLPFSDIVWKYITNEKLDFHEIFKDDHDLLKYFDELKNGVIKTKWVVTKWDGTSVQLQNYPSDQYVNPDEIESYIQEYAKFRLKLIEPMLKQIKNGFYDNIGFSSNDMLFSYILSYSTQGTSLITLQKLQSITIFTSQIDEIQKERFWKVISRYDQEHLTLYLKFVTACTRIPGISDFTIKIDKLEVSNSAKDLTLPTASTCFNTLHYPCYSSDEIAYQKLTYAINYCQTMENK